MGNLILTFIGLLVFTYSCFAGIGYIKISVFYEMIEEYKMKSAISIASTSVSTFDLIYSEFPESLSELTDGDYMEENLAFSTNTLIYEFSSDSDSKFYFCFGGESVTEFEYLAYAELAANYYDGKLSMVSDCDTGSADETPVVFPAELTFRFDYN
ncbi:hypothetical protein [Psychromonas sp. SP041]|uniref:hypothetical protein n=1 Tax=Psychromonas sp. SP041 TaxID=1365007 RepID=UPI000414ED85|nr:hypothetical protein [Psychromonas sp. SP041]